MVEQRWGCQVKEVAKDKRNRKRQWPHHLRATRLRSRPSSSSTSIGSPDGKITGGAPALFEALMLLALLVRRLEDGV